MPQQTKILFTSDLSTLGATPALAVVGRKSRLADDHVVSELGLPADIWAAMLEDADAGDWGTTQTTRVGTREVVAVVLPEPCSRHNSPSRAWAIPALLKGMGGKKDLAVVLAVDEPDHALAAGLAVARSFPIYDGRSGEVNSRTAMVCVLGPDGVVNESRLAATADGVRLAARLFDAPANELTTTAFLNEAQAVADASGVSIDVVSGQALQEGGFGGIWGVGQAATHGPALVALRYSPEGASRTVAWVGKGIVYDTGGLSIKGKDGMPGMKGDMGGAAAVLGAFQAAVAMGVDYNLVAVLCLAENAVGPDATRPDDIHTLYSGKTVEINNTDAEGRLVLADGVAWVCEQDSPDLLVDCATLTGAALVACGKVHAAIYTNREVLEVAVVTAGRKVGEPCHPLVYAPELLRKQFKSPVADMKNSVKDRANAQSSSAGQFVGNHLPEPAPPWIHVDLAGPAWNADDRGTGYGVGLLVELGAGPECS